jgi:predicted transcriptional regulator
LASLIEPGQLKRARVQTGVTQKGLADLAGVSQSIIAKIESGRVDPSYSTLAAISRALSSTDGLQRMSVSSIMSHPVVKIHDGATLMECISLMRKKGFSQIPVSSGENVVGVVTESYITELLSTAQEPTRILQTRVKDHPVPTFPIVGLDTPVEALFSLFVHFPAVLVSSNQRVDGIITKIDLLTAESKARRTPKPSA